MPVKSLADAYIHTDGTLLCQTPDDRRNEDDVAHQLSKAWRCEIVRFGLLSPIDFYAKRHDRMSALIELKCRTHDTHKFDTVFLNVRKWLALGLGEGGFGVPSIFVVRFTDALLWIRWAQIDARSIRITGWRDPRKHTDVEPCIEVPVADMRVIEQPDSNVPRGTDDSAEPTQLGLDPPI